MHKTIETIIREYINRKSYFNDEHNLDPDKISELALEIKKAVKKAFVEEIEKSPNRNFVRYRTRAHKVTFKINTN